MTSQNKGSYVRSYDEESFQDTNTNIVPFQHQTPNYYPSFERRRRYGNVYVFCWFRGQPLITLGPHWWLFLFAWLALEGIGFLLYRSLDTFGVTTLKPYALALILWEGFIFGLTALKNPGIVIPNEENSIENAQRGGRICSKCKIIRNQDMSHCPDCDICVSHLDHHCPWTGKCIAKGNLWPFYVFIASTSVYFFGLMLIATNNPLIRNT